MSETDPQADPKADQEESIVEAGWEADGRPASPGSRLADQPWLTSLLRPVLIGVMAACLIVALLAFVRHLAPMISPGFSQVLIGLGVAAAVIGSVSTTWLAQPTQRGRRNTPYRLIELVFLLVLMRVTTWAATSTWPAPSSLLIRPLDTLLDGYFWTGLLAIGLAWSMAAAMTSDLLGLALQPDDIYAARTVRGHWQDTARPVYTDRPAILRRFVGRWLVGGILLVLLAAGTRVGPSENGFFALSRQNIDPNVVGAIVVFFLLGLVLISQGQLALLRARWTVQKTPSAPGVLRNWPVYALGLILLIGVAASLLPFGGTFRLAQIIAFVLQTLFWAVFGIFRFILSLLMLLIALLTGRPPEEPMPTPEPAQPFVPPEALPPTADLPPWAGGAVFWILMLLLLGYAAYIYFGGRGVTWGWAKRLWQLLRERWLQLFGAYQTWRATRVADEASAAPGTPPPRRGFLSWLLRGKLTPDQQARYYYLSLLEQAEQAGHPRQPAETPLHYAPRLAQALREESEEEEGQAAVDALTSAFVDVRYASRPVDSQRSLRLKEYWQQVLSILKVSHPK